MATTNQHSGLIVARDELNGHDPSADEKPTLPAPPMRRKSRLLVLSCLLVATAGSAAIEQWTTPQLVAAEARREERAREALTVPSLRAASNDSGTTDSLVGPEAAPVVLDADAPRMNDGVAVTEGESQAARVAPEPKRKVRESDALVRDGRRLLRQHPALARQLFEVAIAIDARNPHAHAGRAYALRRLHKPLEARAAIEQALRIRPKRAHYRALLAVLDAENPQAIGERADEDRRAN